MIDIKVLNELNAKTAEERLSNLHRIVKETKFPPEVPEYINNHIHTIYSFSPYSPTAAVYAARAEGLCTAGIIDHDSIAGAKEFIEAGKIVGMPVTVGMECRVDLTGTRLEGMRTNNPDQKGISYMTIQSVPHDKIDVLQEYFAPFRAKRGERNRKMVAKINEILPSVGLDYNKDVLPISMAHEGGGVTERHVLYALAKKLTERYGRGETLIMALTDIGVELSEKNRNLLMDTEYYFYEYDLLGILKSAFIGKIYIDADEECPKLRDVVKLCDKIDAYLCYPYLGDVIDSVTGDKKPQKFEDDYLEEVFECMREEGIKCVTYMPTRNSREQLERIRSLCDEYDMFQVSGEDINTPRQSFVIKAMEDPMLKNLIDATWTMIEHENSAPG